MHQHISDSCDTDKSDDDIKERFSVDSTGNWSLPEARTMLQKEHINSEFIKKYAYRPFDVRRIYYSSTIVDRLRVEVMREFLCGGNLGLCAMRQTHASNWGHIFVTELLTDAFINEIKDGSSVFPLYLYPAEGEMQLEGGNRRPNLNPEFIKVISDKLGLTFVEDGKGDLNITFGPEDVFNYAYAIFHSPTYRSRYAVFLNIDFPRLPVTSYKELFKTLAEKGTELVSLHLMESPSLNKVITNYPVTGSNTVEKVTYDENNQRVYINKTQYFEGVPQEVWDFHIGGYQVCHKWLKDRKGRTLTYDELTHYQKVIVALKETIRLMDEIDELIPGWPVE